MTRGGATGDRGAGRRSRLIALLQHRRRRQRRRRERFQRRRIALFGVLVVIVGGAAALVAVGWTGASTFESSCSLSSLRPVRIGQNSFVYAADGTLLGAIPAEKNREPLSLSRMSSWLGRATVAIEDRRFYEHGGLDFASIVRAAVRNAEAGRIVEGGSTITQQLVRNLYIGDERSLARKLKEACLALKLDRAWPKHRILETYMNQVYYGNHAYGVEAAAQTYFSEPARKLDLEQAALVAGLPQAPSLYDPFERPQDARARRNEVLRALLGSGEITRHRYESAAAAPLHLRAGQIYTRIREPYFFSFVRDQLVARYGANTVRSGGLRVYTTIDPRSQRLAARAIRTTLDRRTDPAAAVVAINPANGAIRAMTSVVPGRKRLQFNLAAQGRRQAGSSFKPFVLATAIEQGIDPDRTMYMSAPFHYQPDPACTAKSCVWDVKTYEGSYYGPSTISEATLRSDNTVYARLTLDVGPENVVETAHAMGVTTPLEPVPSVGLGSNGVSVLEMASAYATLAAGGVYSEPMAIRKVVVPDGHVDTASGWGEPIRHRALPSGVAYAVTKVLERNILAGTATRAFFGRPAAAKTGTTDDFADAWLCGYTPDLAAAVWVGYPNARIEMRDVHGIHVAGGTFPAMIWHLFMAAALVNTPVESFLLPGNPAVYKPFHGQYALTGKRGATGGEKQGQGPQGGPATTGTDSTSSPTTTAPPPTTTAPPPTTTGSTTSTTP